MSSPRRFMLPAALGLEIASKLLALPAFGSAFAATGDRASITKLVVEATVPVTAVWLVAIAVLTRRIAHPRSTGSEPSARTPSQSRLPGHFAVAGCVNWCVTFALVAARAGTLAAPAGLCLLAALALGAAVLDHALGVWLVHAAADAAAPDAPPVAAGSLRLRLASYVVGSCGAPALYATSLALAARFRPLSTAELALHLLIAAAFAIACALAVALAVDAPIRQLASALRAVAGSDQPPGHDLLPQPADLELGALVAAANQLLDRLAASEHGRLALQATLDHNQHEQLALQSTLEDKVEERTARLLEANEQIAFEFDARAQMERDQRQAQRLEAVGRLAAGIAHEINTPVQFVSDSLIFIREGLGELLQLLDGNGDMITRIAAGEPAVALAAAAAQAAESADLPYLREQLPQAVDRSLDGLSRVATIVRAMKNHAHPDRREMAAIDLNEAIASTLTIARNEYKYVADLDTDFGKLPLVTCYAGDFNQVIINLIVNAAHAIGDVVGTSGAKGKIIVKTWCEEPDVLVTIEDTGGGIPEYIRDYIFEPFFTTKELGKGTGQGLTIARAVIVEKHGGTLTFEPRPGGTIFQIRIPIAGAVASTEHAA